MNDDKKPVGIISSYIMLSIAAILPHRARIVFTFLLNFFYNNIRTTMRLIFSVLSSIIVNILTFFTYFFIVGICAFWVKIFGKEGITQSKNRETYFLPKAPADKSEERFLRQY
ncbi:MAG: hypothetical protein FJZ04_04385 [Candidatus Moranbacteria bacterium]|nr:hypothetical protein [Candidatus Moranbacteria bacterium]